MRFGSTRLKRQRDPVIGSRTFLVFAVLALSMLGLPGSAHASAIGAIAFLVTKVFGEGAVVRELGHVGRAADGKTTTQATGVRAADVAPVRATERDLAAARNPELPQRTALQRPESSASVSAGPVDAPQAKAVVPRRRLA